MFLGILTPIISAALLLNVTKQKVRVVNPNKDDAYKILRYDRFLIELIIMQQSQHAIAVPPMQRILSGENMRLSKSGMNSLISRIFVCDRIVTILWVIPNP